MGLGGDEYDLGDDDGVTDGNLNSESGKAIGIAIRQPHSLFPDNLITYGHSTIEMSTFRT